MTRTALLAGTALFASAQLAAALGLDRSNQDITAIFEPGNFAELSFGSVRPSLTGSDVLSNPIANVGNAFTVISGSLKYQVNEKVSVAVIFDQPFGADVEYGGNPASTMLGGTAALLESSAITALGRYAITDRFSVHAGLRHQRLSADITLSGLAYGPLSGYNVELTDGSGTGWVAGVAYEIPDIALRVALTYNSAITNTFTQTETINGIPIAELPPSANPFGVDGLGELEVEAPEAWNLDFQTGIAPDTLLFGQIRRAFYSQTILSPEYFDSVVGVLSPGDSITDIEDGTAYTIGVGRRFSPNFSASVSVGYEAASSDDLVSPLSPTNGLYSLAVGGQYTMDDVVLSGGVRYTWLGDAQPETGTPDVARGTFTDNTALALGLSIGFRF